MHSPVQRNMPPGRRTGRATSRGEKPSPTRLHSPVRFIVKIDKNRYKELNKVPKMTLLS